MHRKRGGSIVSETSDKHVPASVAMRRGVDELRALNTRLEKVEHHLEALLLKPANPLSSTVVGALQEIDLVVQSTEALAEYFSVLGTHVTSKAPPVSLSDAVAPIRLRQLAERLAGLENQQCSEGATEMF